MNYQKILIATLIVTTSGIFTSCRKHDNPVPETQRQFKPELTLSKTFGGDREDYFTAIVKTADGGYVMAGSELSKNGSGDIPVAPAVGGNHDMLIIKVGADGNKQWVTTIGGDQDDDARSIVESPDGSGYVIAGYTNSNNTGDIPATKGGNDMLIVKLGADGSKQWVKTFGGNAFDEAHAIEVSADRNSYVVAGSSTTSNNGDIPQIHAKQFSFLSEVIVLNLELNGSLRWIKNFGGDMAEDVRGIAVSPDGSGYALAGYTSSNNKGDIPATHDGQLGTPDMVVFKLGTDGNKQWVKTFGGVGFDFATSIVANPDGSFIMTGTSQCNNSGDIPASQGDYDVVLAKLDAGGNKQWLKTFGGNGDDEIFSIVTIPGGDYLVGGFTGSNNSADIPQSHAAIPDFFDMLVARIGPDGSRRWIKTYGGNDNDQALAVAYKANGGFAIVGLTASSNSFDVPANHGNAGSYDGWLINVKN